jgi:hypothetical protein
MDISRMVDNQEAGFCHFDGAYYARIGIVQTAGVRRFKYNDCGTVTQGPTVSGSTVWLRSKMDITPNSTSWYSTDGVNFTQLGGVYLLKAGDYYGCDKLALYSFNNTNQTGSVDFDWFNYTYAGPKVTPVAINSQKSNSAVQNNKVVSMQCINGRRMIKLPGNMRSDAQVTMYDIAGRAIPFTVDKTGKNLTVNTSSNLVVLIKMESGRNP